MMSQTICCKETECAIIFWIEAWWNPGRNLKLISVSSWIWRLYVLELALYIRDIWEVQRCRWWEYVLEILGAWFLEAVKWRVSIVLGQALVIKAITRQRHCLVLGQCYTDDLPIHLLAIQMAHCFSGQKRRGSGKDVVPNEPNIKSSQKCKHCPTKQTGHHTGFSSYATKWSLQHYDQQKQQKSSVI